MKEFFLVFIPLFVTIDALGTLPIFHSLTYHLTEEEKKKIIGQSILTALCLAIGFIFLGRMVFNILGITMADFMVAGGAVLFCIAIVDLVRPGKQRRLSADEIGAVPIGTPLIVGPAVLTTSLMLVDQHGLILTLISILLNISLACIIFLNAGYFIKILGKGGANALSRVMALLLTAIAVMMVRKGLFIILQTNF
jgi:multiple antibiotic resistance protein